MKLLHTVGQRNGSELTCQRPFGWFAQIIGDFINAIGQKLKGSERANAVRFAPECVAKLLLRRWSNRDSVELRR
jgi:hypothetical protein